MRVQKEVIIHEWLILLILFQIIQEIKKKHVGIPGEGEYSFGFSYTLMFRNDYPSKKTRILTLL